MRATNCRFDPVPDPPPRRGKRPDRCSHARGRLYCSDAIGADGGCSIRHRRLHEHIEPSPAAITLA